MVSESHTPMAINRQPVAKPPEVLKDYLGESWEAFAQAVSEARYPLPRHPDFIATLLRVWAASDFVTDTCIREPSVLFDLLGKGDLLADYGTAEYSTRLGRRLRGVDDEAALGRALRGFRQREMLRIAWRDLAGWAPLMEVLGNLSDLADTCISRALGKLDQWALEELGPGRKKMSPSLVVLAMGKLGARELNFSSDIDLIFAYPEDEPGWASSSLSAEEYYTRVGRSLIHVLDNTTELGFVFRVDMRLRPYGDSGPLVASFDALGDYYQLQGREWERYAMVKARPLTGSRKAIEELTQLLRPFVYRRYLDFGAFESLRNLKEQIAREVERKGMQDNIKLGLGGIREIEFIAQAFQLVRGGRQPKLQCRGVLAVLDALASLGYLPVIVVLQLSDAYAFLRRVENRLQAFADQQVHELPVDELGRIRLAFAMGFDSWEAFAKTLAKHRRLVQEHFEQVFAAPQGDTGSTRKERGPELGAVWLKTIEPDEAAKLLTQAGYEDAGETLRWLKQLRRGPLMRFLGEQGRQRLDQIMPMILSAAAAEAQPTVVLKRLGELLESIAGRTAYLTLLVENPLALSQLVQLCSASSWIATQLAQHPILLDELLDPRTLYAPLDKDGLRGVLETRLGDIPESDLELQMDGLRQFQQAAALHVAAAEIVTDLAVPLVSDHLTHIAELVLEHTLRLAWDHLVERHGQPRYVLLGKRRAAQFAILGYGKLGGAELGYSSDLDLVFLHDSCGDKQKTAGPQVLNNSEFFTRLGQRIIHILNTFTPAGILYEVDTRLRPNGSSGLLVSSLEAFSDYQRRSAWTWENQALVRARVVAGDGEILRQFERIRSGVLARPRKVEKLREEVAEMRQRMRQELDRSNASRFDLKQGPGGIADIEFMVQYGVLLWSSQHPELLRHTDNLHLLQAFSNAGLMSASDANQLRDAYFALRKRVNQLALQETSSDVGNDELSAERDAVRRIWGEMIEP